MLLARHRKQGGYYAVKVLDKQMIIERKEVCPSVFRCVCPSVCLFSCLTVSVGCVSAAKACDGWKECAAEGSKTSIPGGAALLLPDTKDDLLCPRLCKRRRGMWVSEILCLIESHKSSLEFNFCASFSCFTTCRERVRFQNPELLSTLQRSPLRWDISTLWASFTGAQMKHGFR